METRRTITPTIYTMIILCTILLGMGYLSPAMAQTSSPTNPTSNVSAPVNPQAPGFAIPTNRPNMSALLKGQRILLSFGGVGGLDPAGIHNGTSYILAEYQGTQKLSDSGTLIIQHPKDVVPISSYATLQNWDPQHIGKISGQALTRLSIALLDYNAHGYLTAHTTSSLGITSLEYNPVKNTVQLFDQSHRLVLGGELVNLVP